MPVPESSMKKASSKVVRINQYQPREAIGLRFVAMRIQRPKTNPECKRCANQPPIVIVEHMYQLLAPELSDEEILTATKPVERQLAFAFARTGRTGGDVA